MKKILLTMLTLLLVLPMMARDFEYTYEGQTITYTVIDEEGKTCKTKDGYYTSGNLISGEVILPEYAKDNNQEYKLIEIGIGSFRKCTNITKLTIPKSVLIINEEAFTGCNGIISLTLPNSLTSIEKNAFYGCSGLTHVVIPDSVRTIGFGAFCYCYGLKSVTLPTSIKLIDSHVFSYCGGLTEIELPNSITSIRNHAFYYSGLITLKIPDSVLFIGEESFSACPLTSLEIGNSVISIGRSAFSGCKQLNSVIIGNSVSLIEWNAFRSCSSLTSIVIPNSVTEVGERAFCDCALDTIIIGTGIQKIGAEAFKCKYPLSNLFITAQVAPQISYLLPFNNTINNLWYQSNMVLNSYQSAPYWNEFNIICTKLMIEPIGIETQGNKVISGKPGDAFQLKAKLIPEDVTLPQIFWRSTNPDIATVDTNGLVTLHSNPEDVMINAGEDQNPCVIIAESLYFNGPILEIPVFVDDSGVDEIYNESFGYAIDYSQPYEVYNLNGMKVGEAMEDLAKGIYVVRQGSKAVKVSVK